MAHAEPLDQQPSLDEYVGVYDRTPYGRVPVRLANGGLVIGEGPGQMSAVFYAPDMAYSTTDGTSTYVGLPIEFIRDESGEVGWVRVDGRIALKV